MLGILIKYNKYILWVVLLFAVGSAYYYVFNEPARRKESHKFREIHSGKYISFYNIDNQAKVLVNDSVIFDSDIIDDNPPLDLEIGLKQFLKEGKNFVKIELMNRDCPTCQPTPWEIRYELIENGEVVEYVHESSFDRGDSGGVKFQRTYEVFHQAK